jgi:hypothetical protein
VNIGLVAEAEAKQALYATARKLHTDHVRAIIADHASYEVAWWRELCGVDVLARDAGKG